MKNITYKGASAGSGKTYSLTEKLAQLIIEGKATPEQLIITTFTKAAAAEIKERAKEKLYQKAKEGHPELFTMAQRLDQALICTIDGVCNSIVNRYWYYLGLNPDLSVLTDEDKDFIVNQSLADIATKEELSFFSDFGKHFGFKDNDYWKNDLSSVVSMMNSFNIGDLSESEEYSIKLADRFRIVGYHAAMPTEDEVSDILSRLVEPCSSSKTNKKKLEDLSKVPHDNYSFLLKLIDLCKSTKKTLDCTQSFVDKYSDVYKSEEVFELVKSYINKIFDMASRWKESYENYKKVHHVLDFSDMDRHMFTLLTDEKYKEACKEIASMYKYAFVDEYQDCSPLQVQIFDKLSDLMTESFWVGDSKQAIYGFRGSDSVLTEAVVNAIGKTPNCKVDEPLSISRRSVPAIVDATNKFFLPLFKNMGMEEKSIILNPWDKRASESSSIKDSLRLWSLRGRNIGEYIRELTCYIIDLKNNGVDLKDVAVIARKNDYLDTLAASLQKEGISVDRPSPMGDSVVASLIFAILDIIQNPGNEISKVQIAYLVKEGYTIEQIIDSKLEWNQLNKEERDQFLIDVPLIREVVDRQPELCRLSIKSLLETVIVEFNIHAVSNTIKGADRVDSTLQTLIAKAAEYEDRCARFGLPSTINGYMSFINGASLSLMGDENAIHLVTYHASKGLQWKYVILTQLDQDPNASASWYKYNYGGVHVEHLSEPSVENLYPPMTIRVQPWIYGDAKGLPESLRDSCDQDHISKIRNENIREATRLLYVGFTRAADVLILAPKSSGGNMNLDWISSINGSIDELGLIPYSHPDMELLADADADEDTSNEKPAPKNHVDILDISAEECVSNTRDISPSSICGKGSVERLQYWDQRLHFNASLADNEIGDCLHMIFAGIERDCSSEHINEVLLQYGLDTSKTKADDIVDIWKKFYSFMSEKYGVPSKTYHELGFRYKKEGSIYSGSMDFVWETEKGYVLVDYKTCQLGVEHIEDHTNKKGHYAGMYKGQLDCYAYGLELSGKKVIDKLVFYPSSGLLVRFVD